MATQATDSGDTLDATSRSVQPRRRAGLTQVRSRDTRRRLVRTAMRLWTERGFETGIEDTTVDEIVAAAGVTKGTFYFHFAHKEEILLELGYQTAATSVKAAPPAAVGRAMSEFMRPRRPGDEPMEMAQIIEALYTDCLIEWSRGRLKWLNPALQRRTSIVLAGLRPGAAFPAPEKP